MQRDEIIEIAKQSGMNYIEYISDESMNQVEKFVELVEEHERYECAELCLNTVANVDMVNVIGDSAHYVACADAIRARGNKE